MGMTMELVIVIAVLVAGMCFVLWSTLQYIRESRQYRLALRSMSLEEQRFALQKNLRKHFGAARASLGLDPTPKQVEREGGATVLPFRRGEEGPPPEVIADLAEALSVAKELPPDEAAEYLRRRGYPMVPDGEPEDLSS